MRKKSIQRTIKVPGYIIYMLQYKALSLEIIIHAYPRADITTKDGKGQIADLGKSYIGGCYLGWANIW